MATLTAQDAQEFMDAWLVAMKFINMGLPQLELILNSIHLRGGLSDIELNDVTADKIVEMKEQVRKLREKFPLD